MKLLCIFGDRMILQRDRENRIIGYDTEAKVRVTIGNDTYEGDTVDGRFEVVIPPMPSTRDIDIVIEGSQKVTLHDVCFGDVFILAGQSNMELPVFRTFDISKDDVDGCDYPYIRQYRLTPDSDYKDLADYVLPSSPWTSAVKGQIDEMSAYGFFTFRKVFDKTGVPVGLILNAQGGASIESWMREEDLADCCDELDLVKKYYGKGALSGYLQEQFVRNDNWRRSTEISDMAKAASAVPSDASEVNMPSIIKGITGSSWLYKEFTVDKLPESEEAFLYLGEMIDADRTYINGTEIGRTEYMYPPRKYPFASSILREGTNLIAVRLINESSCGGFVPEHPYYIRIGEEKTDLTGTWLLKREMEKEVFIPGRMMVSFPSILYKASITTIKDIEVRGIFWYQGESNGEIYEGYDVKFSRMIASWRELFGEDIPVITTVMPDYINPQSEDISKVPFGWREIQRQQREASAMVDNCYVVDGQDLGAMFELHPQKKAELGERAASVILENLYYNK